MRAAPKLTKTGQPRLGSILDLRTVEDGTFPFRVVGKLLGRGGSGDLIGIVIEDVETRVRQTLAWPLEPTT